MPAYFVTRIVIVQICFIIIVIAQIHPVTGVPVSQIIRVDSRLRLQRLASYIKVGKMCIYDIYM